MTRATDSYPGGHLAVVLDCADLDRAAAFWGAVLGYTRQSSSAGPYLPLVPSDGAGVELLLQRVPEGKRGKNRLHLDLRTRELDREVAHVTALGAVPLTTEPVSEGGWLWHVLADPDGNEFCVLRPPAGYW